MIIWVYDKWGNQIQSIKDFNGFVHDDEIGALDFIEFTLVDGELQKDDYLVWRDEFGIWHEHIVRSAALRHAEGVISQHIYAINSVAELTRSYINERNSYGFKNQVALERLLQDTRWDVGTVWDLGTNDVKFYHTTVYEGLLSIIKKWGGEIYTTINVSPNGVYQRRINHVGARGADNGLLFTYGFDMGDIERKVELDDVYTRIHVFGKGEPTYGESGDQTGFGRRIDFSDINNGKDYLEDNEAMLKWGVLGKNNVRQHSEGVVIFEECEDPVELLVLGKAELEVVKQPRITYTANVALLAKAGMQFKNAQAGDKCYIRDKELDERLNGRITHVRRFYDGITPAEVTLGNIKRTVKDMFSEQQSRLDNLLDRSSWWDDASHARSAWLDYMMNNLNDFMNAVGGFAYWEQGIGITVYDRPVDKDPTMAIQLNGAGFRIANSKKSDGTWDWRTFGTGDGFTADLINVGVLRCGDNVIDLNSGTITLLDGTIQDLNGKNFWNLATGELRISSDAQYIENGKSQSLGEFFQNIYNEIGDVDVALDELDAELRQAIEDGSVSEAEAAAVAKILQRVQTEQVEAISAYNSVYSNSLLETTPKTTLLNAKNALYGTDGLSGAYGTLVTRIKQVIACTTADQIKGAMENYNIAYQAYQSNRDIFTVALRNAETAISNKFADDAASDAVNAQSQEFIFKKLTNDGESQGIYMAKDPADNKTKLYMNATYMKIGTITDGKGNNYWNLDTGDFKLSATNTKVGDQTLASYVSGSNSDSFATATAEQVFNKLTNNKKIQGITLTTTGDSPGLYINASYINSGTMSADYIKAGTITASAGGASWNLNTGVLTTTQMNAGALTASKGLLIQNSASADFKTLIKNGGLQIGGSVYDSNGLYIMNNMGITIAAYTSNGEYRGQIICPNQLDIQTPKMTVMNTSTATNITGATGTRVMMSDASFSGGGLNVTYFHATYCHGISGPAASGKG